MSIALCLGFAAVACTLAAPAGAALIIHKDLSYDVARTMAEESIAACAAKGYATSAVVVDRDGETMVAMRGDKASPHTMENARRKAYTAMTFRTNDHGIRQEAQRPHFGRPSAGHPAERHRHSGRPPIKVGDAVIGGIGVSGSPGVDDECVNAGMEKVKDQLK